MKNNIYLTCGVMALAFAACSEDNGIVGTSTEGIYILQACFLEHLLGGFIAQKTTWLLPLQQLPAGLLYGLALPVAAILIVTFCTLLYQSTRYFPIAGRILFGGAPVQS